MFKTILRAFGIGADPSELDKFEPIYGLTKRSLDEWLSRNPELRKKYDIEMAARLQRSRAAHTGWSPYNEWARRSRRYLVLVTCALRLLSLRVLLRSISRNPLFPHASSSRMVSKWRCPEKFTVSPRIGDSRCLRW